MSSGFEAILSPPILFFALGFLARYVGTDLRLPESLSKFFSIYLLIVIGFEGGVKLSSSPVNVQWALILASAVFFALLHPIFAYLLSSKKTDRDSAIALSASYGSVSVVTFIAALNFLDLLEVPSSPQLIAILAVMEFPAILMGVLMHQALSKTKNGQAKKFALLREAIFGTAPLILIGSLVIGGLTGEEGGLELKAFTQGLFKGFLSLYLLDLGSKASYQLQKSKLSLRHLSFGLYFPLMKAAVACVLFVFIFGLEKGDALLMTVLFASASYIAVPAAMETMLPKANAGIYVTLPLAITFPFNVLVGIPVYWWLIEFLSGL